MHFGISIPAFADFSDPRVLAELAHDAETAGWDGFFLWDAMFFDPTFHPMADPWVALAAVAMSTQRMRIGPMITPLARRRPWKLARETVSVDVLSNGRLTLGVGLGDPAQWEFGFFDEVTDPKIRARCAGRRSRHIDRLVEWSAIQLSGRTIQCEGSDVPPEAGTIAADPDLGRRLVA